jgi:hypothetical protein
LKCYVYQSTLAIQEFGESWSFLALIIFIECHWRDNFIHFLSQLNVL